MTAAPESTPRAHDVEGGAAAVFASVEHDGLERPELVQEDHDLGGDPQDDQEEDLAPLADTFVALLGVGCRMLDEENPLTDVERAELHAATAALEKRYAPQLANAGDAILWTRFAVTVGVVVRPRASAYLEKKREREEAASHLDGQGGVGQDLRPSAAPEIEAVGAGAE